MLMSHLDHLAVDVFGLTLLMSHLTTWLLMFGFVDVSLDHLAVDVFVTVLMS